MKLKSNVLAVIVLVMMFGGILFTDWMGRWNTGTSKEPSLITSGEAVGKPNPADIRGSYSFGDINTAFAIPLEDLKTAFGLPAGIKTVTFQVKGLESMYAVEAASGKEIGADSMRLFVALYTGLPFNVTTDIWMPVEAVNLLKQHGNLSAEQIQYLETHRIGASQVNPSAPANTTNSTPVGVKTEPASTVKIVTGSTTFQQILDWGVSQATIESILGGSMPDPAEVVKDTVTQKGLEFSSYKQSLQAEVDKHN